MNSEFGIAVHALVFLNHKSQTLSSIELAENICTNPARVRKVMAKLKKSDLVITREGLDGGYLFDKNPKEVSLFHISQALEIDFVSSSWKSGDMDMDCLVASGMGNILDSIYKNLDSQCKEHLKHISIDDIDQQIFGKK